MKYALALEGGGTKGSYHAGAVKALVELDIEIEAATGTSIGSINSAYFIQEGWQALYDYWESLEPHLLIPKEYKALPEALKNGHPKDYMEFFKELSHTISQGGLDLSALRETLYGMIDEKKIRDSEQEFGLVTYSLSEMKAVQVMIKDIPEGKLVEYLLASAYLPGFKREKLDGKSFLDGGFYDNLPLNLLINNGYKNIIAIELHGIGLKQRVKDKDAKIIYIVPSESTGATISFSTKTCEKNLKMGYYDTKRIFDKLHGKWYYINKMWSSEKAFEIMNEVTEDEVKKLAEILNLEMIPYKRMLFEGIIPKLIEVMSLPKDLDYNMIFLYIIEFVARKIGIDRFRIISFDDLIELVNQRLLEGEFEGILKMHESILKFLKSTKLYDYTLKEKVVIACVQLLVTGKE